MPTIEIGFHSKRSAAMALVAEVESLKIATSKDYQDAAAKLEQIRRLETELDAEYKNHPIIVQARDLQKQKGELASMLEDARKDTKALMNAYYEEQEKMRQKEEARLQKLANEKAKREAEKAAKKAEKEGRASEAEAIRNAPAESPTVILPSNTPKTSTVFQTRWKFRIKNPLEIPREYLMPDETRIGQVVRATKGSIQIPGIEVYSEKC